MATTKLSANYGKGFVELDEELFGDEEAIQGYLERHFSDPTYAPPRLPAVALKLIEIARRPQIELDDVVEILEQDPMLAAQVLRIAQSAGYGGVQLTGLKHALVRLGLNTLHNIVLEASMTMVLRAPGIEALMDGLMRHSRAAAHACRCLARYAVVDAEAAFTAGLLHEMGLAAGLMALAQKSATVATSHAGLASALQMHEDAGRQIVVKWGLPDELGWIVAAHHNPQGALHPITAVLGLAEDALSERGFGLTGLDETRFSVPLKQKAVALWELNDERLALFYTALDDQLTELFGRLTMPDMYACLTTQRTNCNQTDWLGILRE